MTAGTAVTERQLPDHDAAEPDAPAVDLAALRTDAMLVGDRAEQWVSRTRSRRMCRREDWLPAVADMVAAGARPGANTTTLRVAGDFADRMYRSKDGTVAYCQRAMARRLGLSPRCVALHVQMLRELGLLAWVEQGSRANVLRRRLGDGFGAGSGYKRTATIYAPVAPPAWDRARGHRVEGTGYGARLIGVTEAGRELAVARARSGRSGSTADTSMPPVDNPASCIPSVPGPHPRTTGARSGGGINYTRGRARTKTSPARRQTRGATGWRPQQTAQAMQDVRQVQLHTWWTQGSCVRELAFALRPLLAAGYTWQECARELGRWTITVRPRRVAAYVSAEIRRRTNVGELILPDGSVRPYRSAPADEDGAGYRAWMTQRAANAKTKWEATGELRAWARAPLAGRRSTPVRRRPRGLAGARPDGVLLIFAEIDRLLEATEGWFTSGEELWAQVEEAATVRLEEAGRALWEYAPPALADPYVGRE